MKKLWKKKIAAVLTLSMVAASLLTGCGKDEEKSDDTTAAVSEEKSDDKSVDNTEAADVEARKIVIATTGQGPEPFCYTDENGKLTGYDIELARIIFDGLPQYEIEFVTCEFQSIFTGIDTGLYQVGLNHMGYNTERGEKYIYTDVYDVGSHAIAVRKGYDEIKSLDDLGGHSTQITAASANETLFLTYNERHPDDQIDLTYIEVDNTLVDIANGVVDFEYFTRATLETQIAEKGLEDQIDLVDVSIAESNAFDGGLKGIFYLVSKNDEQLANDINSRIEELISDGTIAELRKEWFGESADELTLDYVETAKEYIANDQAQAGQ
ncbi:MAG: transporter substrate-binding domain-containing protein [Lachnospiraceae bacterium]|nr:transporter substrate-binding domain-containing protein [Lachnospiraceae bacterium]